MATPVRRSVCAICAARVWPSGTLLYEEGKALAIVPTIRSRLPYASRLPRRIGRAARERCAPTLVPDDAGRSLANDPEASMTQRVLAVGIDPAKRMHHAVAVLYPDKVVLDTPVANTIEAIEAIDDRLEALARAQE